jgi:hypothetical protein
MIPLYQSSNQIFLKSHCIQTGPATLMISTDTSSALEL